MLISSARWGRLGYGRQELLDSDLDLGLGRKTAGRGGKKMGKKGGHSEADCPVSWKRRRKGLGSVWEPPGSANGVQIVTGRPVPRNCRAVQNWKIVDGAIGLGVGDDVGYAVDIVVVAGAAEAVDLAVPVVTSRVRWCKQRQC